MREQVVYTANKGVSHSEWLREEPATVYEGFASNILPGYKDVAVYQDGCMHHWILLGSTTENSFITHILVPEAPYLPIYVTTTAHDFVDLLKYLEATLYGVGVDEDFSN